MIEVSAEDGWVVVRLAGEIDMSTVPPLRTSVEDLQAKGHRNLRFDLSAVEFMDSQGLSLLATAQKRASDDGGEVQVMGASGQVLKLLEVTGMAKLVALEAEPDPDAPGAETDSVA